MINPLKRFTSPPATAGAQAQAWMTNDLQRYFINGFLEGRFAASPSRARLEAIAKELYANRVKEGFRWEQKYPHTKDLRPNAADYDPAVLDVLFDSGVPAFLRQAIGTDLELAHVQIRIVFPGASYMDWHRDTHIYNGQLAGNIPPLHKIIYYPTIDGTPVPQLHVAPGSHRRVLPDEKRDVAQAKEIGSATIASSDETFLLFDTSLLHAVVPEKDPRGSLRIIYAFGHRFQLGAFASSASVQERYRARMNER